MLMTTLQLACLTTTQIYSHVCPPPLPIQTLHMRVLGRTFANDDNAHMEVDTFCMQGIFPFIQWEHLQLVHIYVAALKGTKNKTNKQSIKQSSIYLG